MKYSLAQLNGMAHHLLRAKASGDDRYFFFVMKLSVSTGKSTDFVESKILEYARG